MNLIDLQILFQQKITDVNPVFEIDQRPDSYTIVNYLNRSIRNYLKERFVNLPTFEQQLIAIETARDDLRFLITRGGLLNYPYALNSYNWGSRGKRYRMPDNVLIPISLTSTVTRTEVQAMTNQKMFTQWVSRRQAERMESTTNNKTIHVRPISFIEDEFYVCVVGDAYVTSITGDELTYLRKPDVLSFDYKQLSGTSTIDISSISTNDYFKALTALIYVDPTTLNPANYIAGDKIIKVAGYDTITALSLEPPKIGHPWGFTDTPDFPEYMHEDILKRTSLLFLEEAKLKLVPKE